MNIIARLHARINEIDRLLSLDRTKLGQEKMKLLATLDTLKEYGSAAMQKKQAATKLTAAVRLMAANGNGHVHQNPNLGDVIRTILADDKPRTEQDIANQLASHGYETKYPARSVATTMRAMQRGKNVKHTRDGWLLTAGGHAKREEREAKAAGRKLLADDQTMTDAVEH